MEIPEFLNNMINEQYGKEISNKIIEGYKSNRIVSLRVNTLKSNLEKIKEVFNDNNIEYDIVPWSSDALVIKNVTEKEIKELEIYENGEIYLQSLSSMLPPIILEPKEGKDILDMAAAPGGKTTQIAALTNNKAHITACEMNNIRAERLKFNVLKQGASSVYVMQKDSRILDDFFSFDQILLDAPCSGSGTLDLSNPNLNKNFTKKLIDKSVNSQVALLTKALKVLKKGNEMVYSTCSILSCENEDVVNKVISKFNCEIIPIEFDGIDSLPLLPTKIPGTLCVCPNEFYEGFFIAKIRKK